MKKYQSGSGIKVYASSPNDADAAFCRKVQKAGIYLYEVKKLNPYTGFFENDIKYFAKEYASQILASDDEVLFFDSEYPSDYAVMSRKAFLDWFQPIYNTQEPEMPSNKLAGKSFYLDAGHGGKDSGAVNDTLGLHEKIAALDVCLYLGEYLAKQGARIHVSRADDSYSPLAIRASEANTYDATAFISIHLNSADNKSASGIETLVYSLKGTAAELAEKVQRNMIAITGWKNRGVKARPELIVLKKTIMPAILCEIGFISNDAEAKELFRPEIQRNIAYAIADGVIEQFGK